MSEMQEIATSDEKTVEQVSRNELDRVPEPRKRSKATRKTVARSNFKPNPAVYQAALKLANRNPKRLLVVAEDSVIVMNHPGQFTRKKV